MLSLELLHALLSPDARIRDQAETVFRSINVPERVQGLTNLLLSMVASNNNADNAGVSMLAAVLLRRDILKLSDPSMLNELVTPLLHCYMNTNSATNNTKVAIGHSLAEICSSLSVIGGNTPTTTTTTTVVDSVLSKIVSTVIDPQGAGELLISFKLLAALADRAPMAFTRVAVPSLPGLVSSCINQQSNNNSAVLWGKLVEVVVNGAVATTITDISLTPNTTKNLDELVIDETSPAAQIGSQCLLPLLSKLLDGSGSGSTVVIPLEVLQSLSHAAVTCPSLLVGSCGQVLQTVLNMCIGLTSTVGNTNDGGDNTIALAALQVLSSLFSVGDVRHRILSADMAQSLAERVIPVCAQLMAQKSDEEDDDDDDDWINEPPTLVEDGLDDGDGNDEAIFALTLMESFLLYLAGPALGVALPLVRQLLPTGNNNKDSWRHARAGLAILEVGLVAAPVALATHVPEIIQAASSLADSSSSHPRVQYQAIRLLGAVCETHPSVRNVHGQIILERTAAALSSQVSKISALASLVISSYCRGDGNNEDEEEMAQQCIVPFLPDLLKALIQGPLSIADTGAGSVVVRARAMNATACLAEASREAFCPYYAHVMPGLLASVQIAQVDIVIAALQSLTIVGQAVGKEMFESDAKQVLSWIVGVVPTAAAIAHGGEAAASSSFPTSDLLSACARIAAVLEEDFSPYVDAILPALYHVAKAPADISIEEGNETGMQNDGGDDGAMTVAIPGCGFQRISINTSAILEKATNNRIMFELTKALGATFGPRVQETFEIFLPLAKFVYSADVRSTAAQTLSALFDSACAYGEEIGDMSIPRHYLPLLSDVISEQIAQEDPSDTEALYALGDSLSEIYYIAYGYRNDALGQEILNNLSMSMRVEVVKRCMKTMVDCLGRRDGVTKILLGNLTGADEKEDYMAQLRSEDSLLKPLVDSIGYLLKFSKAEFVPIFETCIVPALGKYLSITSDIRASVAAVCLFDDVVEHCGPEAAAKYSPTLLQGIMVVMSDPSKYDQDLVQAAVYGIIQIVRQSSTNIISLNNIQTIVLQLLILTQANKDEVGDDIYLYELAVSTLASLVLFGPYADLKFVNRDVVMNVFLKSLPLEQDEDEAKICHAGLCSLIENGFVDLKVEAPRIISVIGSILSEVNEGVDIAESDTCERFVKILYDMQCNNPQGMQQAFAGLDPSVQNIVGSVVQDFAQSRSSVVTP